MKRSKKDKRTWLEKEIEKLEKKMEGMDPTSEEYEDCLECLGKLTKLNKESKDTEKCKDKLSPNTVFSASMSFVEILTILNYEKLHIIASKAMSRIWKGRV